MATFQHLNPTNLQNNYPPYFQISQIIERPALLKAGYFFLDGSVDRSKNSYTQ